MAIWGGGGSQGWGGRGEREVRIGVGVGVGVVFCWAMGSGEGVVCVCLFADSGAGYRRGWEGRHPPGPVNLERTLWWAFFRLLLLLLLLLLLFLLFPFRFPFRSLFFGGSKAARNRHCGAFSPFLQDTLSWHFFSLRERRQRLLE